MTGLWPRDNEALQLVQVKDPCAPVRTYFLRVPPQSQTARETVAWMFGVPDHKYEPAVKA